MYPGKLKRRKIHPNKVLATNKQQSVQLYPVTCIQLTFPAAITIQQTLIVEKYFTLVAFTIEMSKADRVSRDWMGSEVLNHI